jgi:NitT/TauT family transport system substrate-binding protein
MYPSVPKGRFLAAALAFGVTLLLSAACGSGSGASSGRAATPLGAAAATSRTEERVTLRLGYFSNITHATAIAGVEKGIFAKDLGPNVKLETSTFNAGPAAVEALFSGGLDASYVGPNPAINAFVKSKGEAIRIISGAASGGAFLVVRSDVNGPQDLRGKRLASPQLSGTQDVALRNWLQNQGLKTDLQGGGDVSVTPQENADTLDAFRSGQIAGAWVPEPWASRLISEGGGKVLVDERDLWPDGQYVTTLLIVRTGFMKQHPAVVERLLQGQVETNDYLAAQPDDARKVVNGAIQQITGKPLKEDVLISSWKNLAFTNDPIASSLRTSADAAVALGLLKLDNLDLKRIFDLGPLNRVLKAAGKPEIAAP